MGRAVIVSAVLGNNGAGHLSPYPLEVLVDLQGVVRYLSREYDFAAMESAIEQLLAE